jgi:Ran GTPase-activating protein (RanGAP) involved in mRNA processing and transport
MSEYIRQLESIGGKFNQQAKEAILTGNLTTKNIAMLCDALKTGFTMLTLVLQNCSIDTRDLDILFDTIINRSSIYRLVILTVEVRKWMRMSKYVCNHMTVYFKNQSLKVQFSNDSQSECIKMLGRLLRQNKICRTFNFYGYDLSTCDQKLLRCLKDNRELTTLFIDHFMNIEFLNEFSTSNFSLRQLKLSFWLNSSSTLFGLCQALEQNETLIDLDIMDHTCANDKAATIELLKILRKHKSIKHLRLHVFDVRSSNPNETCLIDSLLHDSFITHLRISESIISHECILALVYASEERRSLTHLEFYNCQLNEDDVLQLQLLLTNESLTHLLISGQQYWTKALREIRQQLQNGKNNQSGVNHYITFSVLEFPQYQNIKLEQKITQYYIHSSICLDEMELIDQDMDTVVKQAIINKQCKLLSLQSNKITSIGMSILADALNNNNTLEILYLGNNYISDDGVDSLVNILSNHNNTLQTLVLQKNRITDKGAKYLAQMLEVNQTLVWLYLGENEISDEGIRILSNVIGNQNKTLEMLVLSSNKLVTDVSVDYLLQMIEQNQTLKKLWIDNCNLSQAGKQRLGKIQETKKDFYVRV